REQHVRAQLDRAGVEVDDVELGQHRQLVGRALVVDGLVFFPYIQRDVLSTSGGFSDVSRPARSGRAPMLAAPRCAPPSGPTTAASSGARRARVRPTAPGEAHE